MRDHSPNSSSSSGSRPAKRRRAPRRASYAPRAERHLAPLLVMRIPSEAAMLAAFDRAQNVMPFRRVGVVAERLAHFVPPGNA